MRMGKLNLNDLDDIIKNYTGIRKKSTLLASGIGEDTCIIDIKSIKDNLMLISSDPITFTSKDIGRFSVIINSNDIYATGGNGYGIILTVLIPPNKTIEDFKILMEEINSECIEHDLEILGGHTEVTNVVNDIVISATIIGTGNENDIVRTSTSKKGDLIFITKPLGIEGTILLFDTVKDKLSLDYYDDIKKFREWLSVRKESMILRNFDISSMHDITEGGLIGALFEMSYASRNGFRIFCENIEVHPLTREICSMLNKDVLRLISSGNLIFTSHETYMDEILEAFDKENIKCSVIGEIIDEGNYFIKYNGINNKIVNTIEDSYLF